MATATTYLKRAARLAQRGDPTAALRVLREGQEQLPDDPRLPLQALRLLGDLGRFDEGTELIARSSERFSHHAPSLLFAGKFYYATRHYDEAEAALRLCLTQQPGNLLARDYLALTRWSGLGRLDGLRELLRHGISHNLDFLCDFSAAGERFLLQGDPPTAPAAADPPPTAAEESKPMAQLGRFARRRRIGRLYRRAVRAYGKRDFAVVLEAMEGILTLAPSDVEALATRAESLLYLCRFVEAEAAFRQVLTDGAEARLGEAYPFLRSMQGYTLMRLGRLDEALGILDEVEPFGPDDFMGYYHRGICLLALERWAEGRAQLRTAWGDFYYSTSYQCLTRLLDELRLRLAHEA